MSNYELGDRIGHGGMGVVYRSHQPGLDRVVAIKFIHPQVAKDEEAVDRFLREARIMAKIDHPNVVRVFDTGIDDAGQPYFVMEFLDGESLRDRLGRGPIPELQVVDIAKQVLSALEAAHRMDIVHRDIKPGNIHLCADGRVKLLDFGIAKATGGTRLTSTGLLIGTAEYMSPEQAEDQAIDGRSDLYSLGIVMYQMLSGEVPFKATTPASVLYQQVHKEPPNLTGASPAMAKILSRALAKDPANRFRDEREMRLQLESAYPPVDTRTHRAAATPTSAAPAPVYYPPRPRSAHPSRSQSPSLIPALIGISVLAVAGLFFAFARPLKGAPDNSPIPPSGDAGRTSASRPSSSSPINSALKTTKIVFAPVVPVTTLMGLSRSGWPRFGRNNRCTSLSTAQSARNLLKWSFGTDSVYHGPTRMKGPGFSFNATDIQPAIGPDGTIYTGSVDRNLYAINPNGTKKWALATQANEFSTPLIGADQTIYVGSKDTNLYAVRANGIEKWHFTTGGPIQGSPAISDDGTVYVGSYDQHLYAIRPNGTEKWRFKTGNIIFSAPSIGEDGTIYVGSGDGNLYAIRSNGTQKWAFRTGALIASSPSIAADGTIYVGSFDKSLYAIRPDGTKKWSIPIAVAILSSPAIGADGTIYVNEHGLYAITPGGSMKWTYPGIGKVATSTTPAIGGDGTIYAGMSDGNLYAISHNGSLKWIYTNSEIMRSSPAIGDDGTVFFSTVSKLCAVR